MKITVCSSVKPDYKMPELEIKIVVSDAREARTLFHIFNYENPVRGLKDMEEMIMSLGRAYSRYPFEEYSPEFDDSFKGGEAVAQMIKDHLKLYGFEI